MINIKKVPLLSLFIVFSNLFLHAELTQSKSYWEHFYAQTPDDIQKPSHFAQTVLPLIPQDNILLELGCGNGRDALYFAEHGIKVYACDLCNNAIGLLNNSEHSNNPTFFVADFTNLESKLNDIKIDTVYSRFSLHSVSKEGSLRAIEWTYKHLQPKGLFLIEARSIHDPLYGKGTQVEKNAYITDHYRRFLELDELVEALKNAGFTIRSAVESQGFAKYHDEDPSIIRIIAQK